MSPLNGEHEERGKAEKLPNRFWPYPALVIDEAAALRRSEPFWLFEKIFNTCVLANKSERLQRLENIFSSTSRMAKSPDALVRHPKNDLK